MATFHISFKKLRRSEGKSSVYLSAYQNREKTKDNRTGATWDYSKKEGFFGSAILSPAGTPAELVKDSGTLWNAVEAGEKRKDAELCRYVDIAIPKELDDGQKKQIVLDYCQENFVDYGMIADIAFHDLDSHNPHAHVMLTLRTVSPNGFGNKQREWNNRENIEAWRVNWEIIANDRLKKYGHKSRIDSRSLKDQKEEAEKIYQMCKNKSNIILDVYAKNIRDFIKIMSHCTLLVSNEGGIVHIAKALNKPTFTIFSPYVNKDHWASFEDGKFHHSIHLLEIKPNLFDSFTFEERKKIEKNPDELYKQLTPEMILPALDVFLKNNL